jgi:hypothetical protein
MAMSACRRRHGLVLAAILAASTLAQTTHAQQTRAARVALSSLTAQGFEIKAVSGNQAGVIGTLVLQKENEVYLCNSKDLSIDPAAFECWPIR